MKIMKKIVAILAVAMMLCSILPMAVMAEEDVTINTFAKTGTLDGSTAISWQSGNFQVVSYKNTSSTAIRTSDADHFRYYVGNKLVISAQNGALMSKVVITCTGSSYMLNNTSNKLGDGWTVTASGTVLTYTPTSGSASELVITIGKQSRSSKIVITPAAGGTTCEHTNTVPVAGKDATCTESGLTAGVQCSDCEAIVEKQETIDALGHNYVDGICTRCNAEKPDGFELTTNVADLTVGDKIIIVAAEYNFAMSTSQGNNNRGRAAVEKLDGIIVPSADVQVLTLEKGSVDGTFAFYTGSGYLYAASAGSNYLRTQTTLDANASWTITIDENGVATIKAQGSNTRNWLRYNNGNSIFSCYGSGQQDVNIYRVDGEAPSCDYNHSLVLCGDQCPNECGYINENTHTYSGDFDKDCDLCGYVRTITLPTDPTEIVNALYSLKANEQFPEAVSLTGVIVSVDDVYNEEYENVTVTIHVIDAAGNLITDKPVVCYRIKGDGANVIAVGDTITVNGILMNYKGDTYEFASGSALTSYQVKDFTFIGKSVTEEGNALAFRFKVGVSGMGILPGCFTQADYSNATITVDGVEYQLVAMGAVVTNGVGSVDIHAKYLYDLEASSAQYAVRIINIDEQYFDRTLTATPYFVIMKDGNEVRIEGDSVTGSINELIG